MIFEEFQKRFDVSRETFEKLATYHTLLLKWQKAINLVSPSTLEHAWERHFADSAQLAAFISPGAATLADIGSGAGFPGLVLAAMRPDLEVHLVESDGRKCEFLKTVSRETNLRATVHNMRIEAATPHIAPDIMTARALAPLEKLLEYCAPWAAQNAALHMLFLKGSGATAEIEQARRTYSFDCEEKPDAFDPDARVLSLKNLHVRPLKP